ncbi:monovalent cation/proton antiporter subunit [alpha proteobacterium U9-1i]|nr:monovalent cation/proton antiporter subunit [alpha proteobacterium U9-1i]
MFEVTLNPGFVLIIGALVVLATPTGARPPIMALAGFAALWLLLEQDFGASAAVAQMGLSVVPLTLDPLNQVFGIAFCATSIALALYSSARRNRYEDAAILLLSGSCLTALFVGDLVSFIAACALAGLASAWVVFASPIEGAAKAGARLLIWQGLEGLLFLSGAAFHLSSGAQNSITMRLSVENIGGAFIFLALMIRVGAPLAHVWVKDAIGHASSAGAAAISAFSSVLGVYALARMFGAEPLLVPIGATMLVLGAFYASAEDDIRRAGAYGLLAQSGLCVALVGIGSPLALAGAVAHAFTIIIAFALLQMALGGVVERIGSARASALRGVAGAMPITGMLMFVGGAAAASAPGFATYASLAVALEAAAQWETRLIWGLAVIVSAVLFVALALRPALAAYLPASTRSGFREAPFGMVLASTLATFLCVAVGLRPSWLYRLMPTELGFEPFSLDRLAPQLEALGAAGVAYLAFRAFRLSPKDRAVTLMDVDSLYRGPVAGGGRWLGVVLLRLYGAWRDALRAGWREAGRRAASWAAAWDRPYRRRWTSAVQLAAICALLVIIVLARN